MFEITILQTFITYVLFYYAIKIVDGATTAVIVGSEAIIVAIVSNYVNKGDKLNKIKLISLIIGMAGIMTMSLNPDLTGSYNPKRYIGILIMIFNVFLASYITIRLGKRRGKVNPIFLASNNMFFGGIMLLIFSRVVEGKIDFNLPINFYLILIWLAFVSGTAFSMWYYVLEKGVLNVSEASMWKFIIPTFGVIFSWIFIKEEKPDFYSILGVIEIISSFIFYYGIGNLKKYREKIKVNKK